MKYFLTILTLLFAFTAYGEMIMDDNGDKLEINDGGGAAVGLVNADGDALGVDASTRALTTIDYSHHEIHDGSHYYIQGFLELGETETNTVKMVVPAGTKWSHFVFDIKSTGICTTYFDEDATGDMTGGDSVTPINNNRNSTNESAMLFTNGVTAATNYTTRLEADKWGSDGFKQAIGGGGGREDEIVLKAGSVYSRTFISGATANIIQFKASWYEHTDRD